MKNLNCCSVCTPDKSEAMKERDVSIIIKEANTYLNVLSCVAEEVLVHPRRETGAGPLGAIDVRPLTVSVYYAPTGEKPFIFFPSLLGFEQPTHDQNIHMVDRLRPQQPLLRHQASFFY